MAQAIPVEPVLESGKILLDRDGEIRDLFVEFSKSISENESRIVSIEGEAGLGKSTLVKNFLELVQAQNSEVRVAYGTSTARLSSVNGYEPVRQALADLSVRAANSGRFNGGVKRFIEGVRESAPDWLPAIPVVGDVLAASASIARSTADRFATPGLEESVPQQFLNIINGTVRTAPLVLVLDDLHWADASTIELVHSLALGIDAGAFLLVLCYRPIDASHEINTDRPHPLKERMLHIARYKRVHRVALRSLEPSAVQKIWRASTKEQLPRRLAARVDQICAGNPLFINEYIGLILDRFSACDSQSERNDVVKNLEHDMPQAVDAVIQARLMHLNMRESRVIEIAAILGQAFDPNELVSLCDGERAETLEILRSLCRMHNVLRPGRHHDGSARYQFEHQTLQAVVEFNLAREDPFDYQELHLRAARLVSQSHGGHLNNLVRIAHHYWEADELDEAALYAVQAAESAAALGAYSEIAELTKRYTCDATSIKRFGKKLTSLAMKALLLTGDHWAVLEIWDKTPPDFKDDDELLYMAARGQRMANRWSHAEGSVEKLVAHDRAVRTRAAGLMLRGEVYLCGPEQRAEAAIVQFSESIGLDMRPENKYRGEGHIGLSHLALGDGEEAWVWLERAVASSDETGSPHDTYESRHWLCKAAIAEMKLEVASALLESLSDLSNRSGIASTVPFHLRDSGRVAALRSDVSGAAALFVEYLQTATLDASQEPRERALADVALQIFELHVLGRDLELRQFAHRFSDLASEARCLTSQELERLRRWATPSHLPELGAGAAAQVAEMFCLPEPTVRAADAIFRFDIPDFWRRRMLQGAVSRGRSGRTPS